MVQVLLCAYIIPPVYHICTGVRELADASNILVSIVHILYNTAGVYYIEYKRKIINFLRKIYTDIPRVSYDFYGLLFAPFLIIECFT